MIISVLNLKGGAGKTTLATNIAAKLAKDGKRTLLMDTDRQRSAMQWYEIRNRQDENLFVSSITEPTTLSKDLMKMEKMYDCMVIDGAPYIEYTTAIVATYSDQVLVPQQPSGFDLGATRLFLLKLKDLQLQIPDMRVMIIFNRLNPRTALARDMISSVESFAENPDFKDFRFSVADTQIQNRIVYADAASTGETVFERKDVKAHAEFQALMDNINNKLDEKVPGEK